jgi:FkbM family methyltransferase
MDTKVLIKQLKRCFRKTWIYSLKDWLQFYSTAKRKQHQKMLKFYSQLIKSGDMCFDVGANVGNRTQVFIDLGAKVIAIEPQDICLKRLDHLFGNNENIIIVGKAVGETEGYADISICEDANTISTLSESWKNNGRFAGEFQWTETKSVSVTTLNKLIDSYGLPRFCKIDVEGFELPVIKGLTKLIPYISFEFSIELRMETKECIYHLQSLGDVEFNFSFGESMEWLYQEWYSPEVFCNKLDAITDQMFWGDIYARFSDRNSCVQ